MTVESQDTEGFLKEVTATQQLTAKLIIYHSCGIFMILWGILVTIGFSSEYLWPHRAALSWTIIRGLGIAGGFCLAYFLGRSHQPIPHWKLLCATLVPGAMGWIWMSLISFEDPRMIDVHWNLVFMFSLIVAGVWIGRAFIVIGVAVTALTYIGLALTSEWFPLWMAACSGGGIILSGIWLRAKGLRRHVH